MESLNSIRYVENEEREPMRQYNLAVAETLEEYKDKTPFEQKVMRDIVIDESLTEKGRLSLELS